MSLALSPCGSFSCLGSIFTVGIGKALSRFGRSLVLGRLLGRISYLSLGAEL